MRKLQLILCLFFSIGVFSQNTSHNFFKPSDTLNKTRLTSVIGTEALAITAGYTGLYHLWYKNYPKSDFHLIDDTTEWLQTDKFGHSYSAYYLSKLGYDLFKWSGVSKKNSLIYGAGLGFLVISGVEVFDGFSKEWGASEGDLAANFIGSAIFTWQEIQFKKQIIVPKFSFRYTPYASARPNVLGENNLEQIMKDYNGQTYWFSANINDLYANRLIPKWLNVAVGFGAEGLVTAHPELVNIVFFPEKERTRQFYLSLDVDLRKINVKSPFLRTIFETFNMIKIPMPAIQLNDNGRFTTHLFYF